MGDALGLDLEVIDKYLSLDLLAQDSQSSKTVIIENQLEPADHKHPGQLLSYAAGLDAQSSSGFQKMYEKNTAKIGWLNQKTIYNFLLLLWRSSQLSDSKRALVFRPVVLPNEWQKLQKQKTGKLSPKHEKRKKYYQKLIDGSQGRTSQAQGKRNYNITLHRGPGWCTSEQMTKHRSTYKLRKVQSWQIGYLWSIGQN